MAEEKPWQVGDEDQRWAGYLDPETGVLRNLVEAQSWSELRVLEDDLVEARAIQLVERPVPQTFDLKHLQAIHRRLFQDVYPWAGETRTVDMGRGGDSPMFLPHEQISELWAGVATALREADHFRTLDLSQVKEGVAVFYDVVNTTHAFREGNGRTQRLFFNDLARQAGYVIDWTKAQGAENDRASQAARMGDLQPLREMFGRLVTEAPERAARTAGLQGFAAPGRGATETVKSTMTPPRTAAHYRSERPERGR